jgi:hypothetical protein
MHLKSNHNQPTAENAQQLPHCPWSLTGVTYPLVRQSTAVAGACVVVVVVVALVVVVAAFVVVVGAFVVVVVVVAANATISDCADDGTLAPLSC